MQPSHYCVKHDLNQFADSASKGRKLDGTVILPLHPQMLPILSVEQCSSIKTVHGSMERAGHFRAMLGTCNKIGSLQC